MESAPDPIPAGGLPRGAPSAVVLTAAGWVVGIAVTVLILGTPYVQFGYRNPSLQVVLESVDGSVALLLAYLIHGRCRRSHRLQDLLLVHGLLMLAVASLGLAFFGEVLEGLGAHTVDVWLPLVLRVAGAVLIAAAALSGRTTVRHPLLQVGPWLLVGAVLLVLWMERHWLPSAVDPRPPPSAGHLVIAGHPALLVAQGTSALCFVLASVAFTVQVAGRADQLLRWLGPGCALAAFARFNYVLFPSLYSDWIYTGDMLRTLSYLLLLVGAAREIRHYWSAQARVAVLEDRRRLARELHDGVVQELGYIRIEAHAIPSDATAPDAVPPGLRERIISACDRGMDEARAAIDALGRGGDASLAVALQRAAHQMVERYGGRLDLDLDRSVPATADQRHALVRITREAVSNALRHGRAGHIRLRLVCEQDQRLLVLEDDGTGFDPSSPTAGYGLTSMRERALALPGSLTIDSAPGRGTVVGVAW